MVYSVSFEGVTKQYPRGNARYASLRHDVAKRFKTLGGRFIGKARELKGPVALDDVSFEINEGESFAIIGPNGAGKTTALKLVSRISYPTKGRVRVRGRVGALIEVGSGVHPELNARENIWLYGQILGMSKREVRLHFDEIVEFAELREVLDRPVKMYSSGMQLRLGFAIASHLEPDVFVVDEALAVGDAGFQAKCVGRMTHLVAQGRTLILVSHNLAAVEATCSRGLFLLNGRVTREGDVREVLRDYLSWSENHRVGGIPSHSPEGVAHGAVRVIEATCHALDGQERSVFAPGEGIEVRIRFASAQLDRPYVNLAISDGRPGYLVSCSMLADGAAPKRVGPGEWLVACRIDELPLRPRLYEVFCDVYSRHGHGVLMDWSRITCFRVESSLSSGPLALVHAALAGPVDVRYAWKVAPRG